MKNILIIAVVIFIPLFLFTMKAHAKGMPKWDGSIYSKNSSSQKEAASDLMKKVSLKGDERVLDVGCGDGKITHNIGTSLSAGSILGLDISPSMIDYANQNYLSSNTDFTLGDACSLPYSSEFDLVVSFTALQWAKDHQQVLEGIEKSLRPSGTFAVSMPMGLPATMQQAVEEQIEKKEWNHYFTDFSTGWNFSTPEEYTTFLNEVSLTPVSIEVVLQHDVFPSKEFFTGFISQWFPYQTALPEHLRKEFMTAVIDRFLELEPLDNKGGVHFKVDRLEVVAKK